MLSSIRVRLTLWYILLLAVILAVFSGGVYLALRVNLYNNLDDSLDSRAQVLLGVTSLEGGRPSLSPADAPADPQGEQFARVFDSTSHVIFDNASSSAAPPIDQSVIELALRGRTAHETKSTVGDDLRVLTIPIRQNSTIVGVLQVGLSEGDLHDTLRILLLIIALAYPLTLVVTSAGGVFLAGRALAPIDSLTRVAKTISAEDLSQRIDMRLPDDEVGRLAHTFNDMIERLDQAFRRQRQFAADASHELRTPLTAIKGQVEVALQRERDHESYEKVLHAVNDEVDRMIRLTGSLLTLARADAGQLPITKETVDLGQTVTDAVGQMVPAANAKGIELEVRPGPVIRLLADEDLLLQLMLNLLDNAVKYTTDHGSVGVTWALEDGQAAVYVSDTGAGISAEHLDRIFDRFYRVDSARAHADGGAGLGLSISRWIAEAHGGSIAAESKPGSGSTFIVRLPLGQ